MQFGFAHRALEAEQEPVIKARRIVDAVFVEDQGVGKGADLQQTLPVGIVARQAETSRPITIPARPMPTSLTRR